MSHWHCHTKIHKKRAPKRTVVGVHETPSTRLVACRKNYTRNNQAYVHVDIPQSICESGGTCSTYAVARQIQRLKSCVVPVDRPMPWVDQSRTCNRIELISHAIRTVSYAGTITHRNASPKAAAPASRIRLFSILRY